MRKILVSFERNLNIRMLIGKNLRSDLQNYHYSSLAWNQKNMIKIRDIQNHVWQTVHAKVYLGYPFYSASKILKVGRFYDTVTKIIRIEFAIRFHEESRNLIWKL